MKLIKFIILFFVLLFGIVLIAEIHQDYLRHFENSLPYMLLSLDRDVNQEKMMEDLYSTAREYNVSFFTTLRSEHSSFSSNLDIFYVGDNIPELLGAQFDVHERVYNSFLLGETIVTFHPLSHIPDIAYVVSYSLVGNDSDLDSFNSEISLRYGGSRVKPGYLMTDDRNMLHGIYFIIGAALLLLTYYDILIKKKEIFVQVTMGERLGLFVLKNALVDTVTLVLLFVTILFGLMPFTYTLHLFPYALMDFSIILILNGLLYLSIYQYNLKKAFSGINASASLLSASFGLKFVSLLISVAILSTNFILIEQALQYHSQKDFFKQRKDYNYVSLRYYFGAWDTNLREEMNRKSQILAEEIYRKYFYNWDIQTYSRWIYSTNSDYQSILYNQNTREYILSTIPELKQYELDEDKVYILLSKSTLDKYIKDKMEVMGFTKEESFEDLLSFTDTLRHFGVIGYDFNVEIITYQRNISALAIDRPTDSVTPPSHVVKHPIIIFNNMDERNKPYELMDLPHDARFLDTLYRAEKDEILAAAEVMGFDSTVDLWEITNVYENYLYHWEILKYLMIANIALSVLILVLEMMLIITVIRLQYSVNAIELSIKKVLGYSLWERNRGLLLLTGITSIVGAFTAILLNNRLNFASTVTVLLGSLLILVVETIVVLIYARKFEHTNITKILKGGAL